MMTVMIPGLLAPNAAMKDLCIHIVRDLHQACSLIRE